MVLTQLLLAVVIASAFKSNVPSAVVNVVVSIQRAACLDPQRHFLKPGSDSMLVEKKQFQCVGHRFVAVTHWVVLDRVC